MKEFKTKFGATLFIEELSHDRHYADREDENYIKIFDSKERIIDYWKTETLEENAETIGFTAEKLLEAYVTGLEACKTVEELLDYMGLCWYFYSTDWKAVAEYMLNEGVYFDADKEKVSESELFEHVCIRVIGKYIIVIGEL